MTEPIRDLAHLSHVELLTPKPDESLFYFTEILGMEVSGESGDSVYLRGFGDYERASVKLTTAEQPGVGHIAYRTHSPEALTRRIGALEAAGVEGTWLEGDLGHGPAYGFFDPDGHRFELFYESERYEAPPELRPALKNQPHRYPGRGVGVRHLDHVNFLAVDPGENRVFLESHLGLRLTEQIVLDDGTEAGVWLASNQKSYDVTYTRDLTQTRGRLHHIAFFVDQREDVLRAADIFLEHGIVMESGPHKHAIQQTFFLYTYEPGGNRIEVCAGGFLIFAPDHEPVVWSQAERAKGQAWGMQTVPSFHIKGTPPVPQEESSLPEPATEPSARARELVRGAYDLHVHVEPDLAQRRIDDLGLARRFAELGLAGFVLKSHYAATAERAAVVRAAVPGVDALGAITLNAGVGGLNAQAVEIAARGGARIVWLPTVDSENEASEDGFKPAKQPVWRVIQDEFAAVGVAGGPVPVTPVALAAVLGVVARHRLVLATGHLGRGEIHTVVDAALAAGLEHIVVTHPDYPTQGVPIDEQVELADKGALLERCFAPIHTGKVSWDQTFAAVRATGTERNVLSTDLGQVTNPPVEDGLALMADAFLQDGFREDEIRTMAVVNTRRLAGV